MTPQASFFLVCIWVMSMIWRWYGATGELFVSIGYGVWYGRTPQASFFLSIGMCYGMIWRRRASFFFSMYMGYGYDMALYGMTQQESFLSVSM